MNSAIVFGILCVVILIVVISPTFNTPTLPSNVIIQLICVQAPNKFQHIHCSDEDGYFTCLCSTTINIGGQSALFIGTQEGKAPLLIVGRRNVLRTNLPDITAAVTACTNYRGTLYIARLDGIWQLTPRVILGMIYMYAHRVYRHRPDETICNIIFCESATPSTPPMVFSSRFIKPAAFEFRGDRQFALVEPGFLNLFHEKILVETHAGSYVKLEHNPTPFTVTTLNSELAAATTATLPPLNSTAPAIANKRHEQKRLGLTDGQDLDMKIELDVADNPFIERHAIQQQAAKPKQKSAQIFYLYCSELAPITGGRRLPISQTLGYLASPKHTVLVALPGSSEAVITCQDGAIMSRRGHPGQEFTVCEFERRSPITNINFRVANSTPIELPPIIHDDLALLMLASLA